MKNYNSFNEQRGQLANGLRTFFFVHFGAYALAIAYALFTGGSLLCTLFTCLCIFATINTLAVLNNFWTAWKFKTPRLPEHQLSAGETLRLFWGELWITIRTYSFYFPFEERFTPAKPELKGNDTPIILVPGFACNRGYWKKCRRFLESQGHNNVYAATLEPVLGSVEANAECLGRFIEDVCRESGQDQVTLIGHSMAGLTIRSYIHDLDGAARIKKAISLGTPHYGTMVAKTFAKQGENLRQMLPKGEWNAAFNQRTTAAPCPVDYVNVVTTHDNIVMPQINAWLPDSYCRNVVTSGIGHLEMVDSKPIFEIILQELQK